MSDESEGLTNDIGNYERLDDDDKENNDIENSGTEPVKGLTVLTCAMFIIAEIAGTGILALPRAVSDAGWTGVALLIICGLLAMYCGAILGNCWMMVREKNVKYRGSHVRDPYPIIGFETFGKPGRILVEVCVLTTLLGGCVVLLLLASKQISSLIDTKIGSFTSTNEFRLWVLICGLLLMPCTWFATPKDIWPFALGASFCTLVACICICVRSGIYISSHGILKTSEQSHSSTASIFKAFGTIAFSFGGASAFPTFQADMKQPSKFKYSAVIAFFGVLLMYLSVSILPYLAFGSNVQEDILRTLKSLKGSGHALVPVAESFITVHLLFTFIIILNPISQQMEVYLRIPHRK